MNTHEHEPEYEAGGHRHETVPEHSSEGVPEAVEATATGPAPTKGLGRVRGRGIEWVRPTDLMARHATAVVGRGVDLHTELARRARTPITNRARDLSERALRLPPLSAFGRRGASMNGPARSGIGLG